MTIHFNCECGQRLKATPASIGKHFTCPVCGKDVIVPESDEAVADHDVPVSQAASVAAEAAAGSKAEGRHSAGRSGTNGHGELPSGEIAESDTVELSSGDTRELLAAGAEVSDHPPVPYRNGSPARKEELEDESTRKYRRDYTAAAADANQAGEAGSSADTARNLYKLVRKMDRRGEVQEKQKTKHAKRPDGEAFDYAGLMSELGRTVLPGVVVIGLFCFLAYWIASSVMSSGREFPPLGDVSGVVTFDGKPLAGATITFLPVAKDDSVDVTGVSSSVGYTDEEGRYELNYVRDVTGAAVGLHQVVINSPLPNGKERLPRRYNFATELGFEVEPGNNTADFDLTSK